jgi:hypothetical protein
VNPSPPSLIKALVFENSGLDIIFTNMAVWQQIARCEEIRYSANKFSAAYDIEGWFLVLHKACLSPLLYR